MFKGLIKKFIKKYFDYKITGEYYDQWVDEKGVYHYEKKYNRKYFLRKGALIPSPLKKFFG